MRGYECALLALSLVVPTAALNGQTARVMPWVPLVMAPKDGVEVHCRWVFQDQQTWMEFSNRGKKAVHFNYYLHGIQSKDAALKNPRIHLDPDDAMGGPVIVKLPMTGGTHFPPVIELVDVRAGDPDEGPFWSGHAK